jgi:hypothetical protein
LTRQAEKRTTLEVIDISSLNILIQQAEYDIQNNSAFYSSADLQALQDAVTEATNYLNSGKENITKEKTKYYEDLLKSIMAKKLSPQINFGSFSFNSVAS